MSRKSNAPASRKSRKRTLKAVKGQHSARSRLYRTAKDAERRSLQQAYTGRKLKKRDFRRLWITRISAACKKEGISYSRFIAGLKKKNIELDRKMLSEIAVSDEGAFKALVERVQAKTT